jgi:hypothetical protein
MAPTELLSRVTASTNLLCYDWEITESRLQHWVFLGQSLRLAFRRTQMPANYSSFAWLQAIAPKLGNTVTELEVSGPSTLSFVRKSHLGLTGFELHLLADWLESPQFPKGSYSLLAPPPQVFKWRSKSRSFEPETNTLSAPDPAK